MRPLLYLVLFILCFTSTVLGQEPPTSIPVPEKIKGVDENCYYKEKYSAAKRRSFYPFSVSDSIVLVSFRHHYEDYPVKGSSVIIDSLIEIRHLNTQEVDHFTDILYNNFYIKPDNIGVLMQCYAPRNAILFFGKNGMLKESIVICFHCSRYEPSSGRYGLFGDDCDQKLDKIRAFFLAMDVKFGTDKRIEAYPGETF